MGLRISDAGLDIIKKCEGCQLTAYRDSVGIWTIGYGHTLGVREGQTITLVQAEKYLRADCANAETAVNSYDSIYEWNQNQFDALVSFTFNCGAGNLRTLLKSGNRTIAEISMKIKEYDKAGGKALKGLTMRRTIEKELFDKPVSDSKPGVSSKEVQYKKGGEYVLRADKLNIRKGPGEKNKKVSREELPKDIKKNSYSDGTLKKGTKVICEDTKTVDGNIWIKVPCGWIAAYYNNKLYVGQ